MTTAWAERLAHRSPIVQRSRDRSVQQARVLIDAARRLISVQGENFTTHELVKEAGVALQTFYRYFSGKDELLLAVIEDMIAEACVSFAARADEFDEPMDRLHTLVTAVVERLDDRQPATEQGGRFIATEHWRLSSLYPEEMEHVTRHFTDLVAAEIAAATAQGTLDSADPERDAWLVNQLVISVYHHHTCAATKDPNLADDLWRFCLRGLGATAPT